MYFYSKDTKKHSRIIKFLFWPMIISFVQEQSNNKISLFGLRLLNQLIANDATHGQILSMGNVSAAAENNAIFQQMLREANLIDDDYNTVQERQVEIDKMKTVIRNAQNPIKILAKKIICTDSTLIMNEATKALKVFSMREDVIHQLWRDGALLEILRTKFETGADPLSQENFLETLASACRYQQYRNELVQNEDVIDILVNHIKSMSPRVTLQALKILRLLAKDFQNLEQLQGGKRLRLSNQLIFTFRWLDNKNFEEKQLVETSSPVKKENNEGDTVTGEIMYSQNKVSELDLIYREISKTFQYILFHYDLLKKLMRANAEDRRMAQNDGDEIEKIENDLAQAENDEGDQIQVIGENELIETLISLGKATTDTKTMLNTATSLAHMTEVLHCNKTVASQQAIEFMMTMLKDTKNIKNHRQGCRYFANLSYYSDYIDSLIDNKITAYMLGAIEVDTHTNDDDTIKYSVIALANLSSHPKFMQDSQRANKGELTQMSKVDRGKIKPLIHLLDSAKQGQLNIIQSACITLCNMASKTRLHQHFVEEPEISTLKNCFQSCLYFKNNKELTNLLRFIIKLICNLAKNPQIVPHLSNKGFLEILFDLLAQEREREIFGNIVTAISYLSVQPDCRDKIIKHEIFPRIIQPLNQLNEIDQKLIMIALPAMLFNGIELQKEFIKNGGIDVLLHFLRKKDKMFQKLACRCFSLLSENQDFLQVIIDYDCLNNLIIHCIKGKRDIVDLDTLKEILKIFINLVLWRKIRKDMIHTACYICDIALMIDNDDINMMSIFCLSQLTENEKSHQFVINAVNPLPLYEETTIAIKDYKQGGFEEFQRMASPNSTKKYGLFSRFNLILDGYNPYELNGNSQNEYFQALIMNMNNHNLAENHKKELMMNLIAQTYLNMARNEQNTEYLVNLQLFQRLKILIDRYFQHKELIIKLAKEANTSLFSGPRNPITSGFHLETSMVCYANSIFSRLLQTDFAKSLCIEENGHQLFVNILKQTEHYSHLFLETLEALKYFLTKKEFLKSFSDIPKQIAFTANKDEDINLSYLQIAALLSFDQANHKVIRETGLIRKILRSGLFKVVLKTLKNERSYSPAKKTFYDKPWMKTLRNIHDDSINGSFRRDNNMVDLEKPKANRKKTIGPRENEKNNEITLAITVLLANISSGKDFIPELLALKSFNPEDDFKDLEHFHKGDDEEDDIQQQRRKLKKHDSKLKESGLKRVIKLFNLISSSNSEIAEQVAIILANVSCTDENDFQFKFISDLCMKTLTRIVNTPSNSETTVLAVLIIIQNFTSSDNVEIIRGMEFLGFLTALENIIMNSEVSLETQQVSLLAISNLYTRISHYQSQGRIPPKITSNTRDFALHLLKNWEKYISKGENPELIRNLVYSSLVLFYNIVYLRIMNTDGDQTLNDKGVQSLIKIISDYVLDKYGEDQLITPVLLDFVILFTKDPQTAPLVIVHDKLIQYCFAKLKNPFVKVIQYSYIDQDEFIETESEYLQPEPRLIKLSSLALGCIASLITKENSSTFCSRLKEMNKLDSVLSSIKLLCSGDEAEEIKKIRMNEILAPFLHFLDTITTLAITKDHVIFNRVYDTIIQLINEKIDLSNRSQFINIIFNLHFKLVGERFFITSKQFVRELYRTYQDYNQQHTNTFIPLKFSQPLGDSLEDSIDQNQQNLVQKKIISLAVSATVKEQNHKHLIREGFYELFKRNLNLNHHRLIEGSKDNELYGLLNIALNPNFLHCIWGDLKLIYKIAFKNTDIISFKTIVDLFSACAKFIANKSDLSQKRATSHFVENQSANAAGDQQKNKKRQSMPLGKVQDMIQTSIKAMIYCLVHVVQEVKKRSEYEEIRYFLNAVKDATHGLGSNIEMILKVPMLFDYLHLTLETNYEFHDKKEGAKMDYLELNVNTKNILDFDDVILNFTLKQTVCGIFFNMRNEPQFFKQQNVIESIKMIVGFVLKLKEHPSFEQRQNLMSNTFRMISQMINSLQYDSILHEVFMSTGALDLIKEGLAINKENTHSTNIDAILCLGNMMNIKEIAVNQTIIQSQESMFSNVLLHYFQLEQKIMLEECLIFYINSLSQYPQYRNLVKEKAFQVNTMLLDRQLQLQDASDTLTIHQCENCRRRVMSTVQNITEGDRDITSFAQINQLLEIILRGINLAAKKLIQPDSVLELGFKILINIIDCEPKAFENHEHIKELFSLIQYHYKDFKPLARQYALRFIYLMTKIWSTERLESFLECLVPLFDKFIQYCDTLPDIRFILMSLERLSDSHKIIQAFASEHSFLLLGCFQQFLKKNLQSVELEQSIDGILKFLHKLSKIEQSHEAINNSGICELLYNFVAKPLNIKAIKQINDINTGKQNEGTLIRILNNIRVCVKITHSLMSSSQLNEENKDDLIEKFSSCCSMKIIPALETIQENNKDLKISDNRLVNNRIMLEIIGIIIYDNMIFQSLDSYKLKIWVTFLIQLLKDSFALYENQPTTPSRRPKSATSGDNKYSEAWFGRKLVFFLDSLLFKNEDKIDQVMSKMIFQGIVDSLYKLSEQKIDQIMPLTWLKLLKISQSLPFLKYYLTIKSSYDQIDQVFKFLYTAGKKSNETLSIYYMMRCVKSCIVDIDINILFIANDSFRLIFEMIISFLNEKCGEKSNLLTMEVTMMCLNSICYMINCNSSHETMNDLEVVKIIIRCLQAHENKLIIKNCTTALHQISNNMDLYRHLIHEESLRVILSQIILNHQQLEQKSFLHLQECLRLIINNSSIDVKYLIARVGLEITESYFKPMNIPQMTENEFIQAQNYMDTAAQFLHIHIHRLLFLEPISFSMKKCFDLVKSLINYEYSYEFNKLGLCGLQSMTSQSMMKQFRYEAIKLYHQRQDIIACIFEKYINNGQQQGKKLYSHKIRVLALDIIINILDCADSLQSEPTSKNKVFNIQKVIYIDNLFLDTMVSHCMEDKNQSNNKYDKEEIRLYAKAFSLLPTSFLKTRNPQMLTKHVKKTSDEDLTIENYIRALNNIINWMNNHEDAVDAQSQYQALYAFFNFLILAQQMIEQHSTTTKMSLDQQFDQISIQILSLCLKKASILGTIIKMPINARDQNVIRISLRILIQTFTSQAKYLYSNDSNIYDPLVPSHLIPRLEKERETYRQELLELLENLHNLELTSPIPGSEMFSADYAHHLHLLSQLMYSSITTQVQLDLAPQSGDEQTRLLPPITFFVKIVGEASLELQKAGLINNPEYLQDNKTLIHRYFFYSFLISAGLPDLMILANKTFNSEHDAHSVKDFRDQMFNTIHTIFIQLSQSKKLNDSLDVAIFSDIIQDLGYPSHIKPKDLQEQGESTTVALIRMMTTNLQMICNEQYKASLQAEGQITVTPISQLLFDSMLQLLIEYEDYEDVISGIYDLLHLHIQITHLQLSKLPKGQTLPKENCVSLIEQSKQILGIAIRHSSIYESKNAFDFVASLIKVSEKYSKNRNQIMEALNTIRPPNAMQQPQPEEKNKPNAAARQTAGNRR